MEEKEKTKTPEGKKRRKKRNHQRSQALPCRQGKEQEVDSCSDHPARRKKKARLYPWNYGKRGERSFSQDPCFKKA